MQDGPPPLRKNLGTLNCITLNWISQHAKILHSYTTANGQDHGHNRSDPLMNGKPPHNIPELSEPKTKEIPTIPSERDQWSPDSFHKEPDIEPQSELNPAQLRVSTRKRIHGRGFFLPSLRSGTVKFQHIFRCLKKWDAMNNYTYIYHGLWHVIDIVIWLYRLQHIQTT